uniref:Zasp-like motif domain-containing protein n=1 Tax=Syphacia muris TaxID=451379 RepID=A0A0N5AGN1_9BILA
MRPEKKKRYSPPNSVRAAPPRQWQTAENTTTPYTNLYTSRATPTEYLPEAHSPLVHQSPAALINQAQAPRELGVGVDQVYKPETPQYYQQNISSTEPVQTAAIGNWQTVQPVQRVPISPEQISVPVVSYSPASANSPAAVAAFHTSSV